MYPNLEAEMSRLKISKTDIQKLLKVRYATVLDKIHGKSRFFYDEALKIKKAFFPNLTVEYLFESATDEQADQMNRESIAQVSA